MIFISYGMPKSASSFAFQLANHVAAQKTNQNAVRQQLPGELSNSFYVGDIAEKLPVLLENVPDDHVYVVKTHQPFDPILRDYFYNGSIMGSVTFRDPYDVVVSMLDTAKRELRKPPDKRRKEFSCFETLEDTLSAEKGGIPNYISGCASWLEESTSLPNLVRIPFETLKSKPGSVAGKFAEMLGVTVETESLVNYFLSDKRRIWEYSRGESGRGYSEIQVPGDHPAKALMDEFKLRYF